MWDPPLDLPEVMCLISDHPTGHRPPQMFFKTPQKREPQPTIGYAESCREFNAQVQTRQVRKHDASKANKAKRVLITQVQGLTRRFRKHGITIAPPG